MIPVYPKNGASHIASVERIVRSYGVGSLIFFQGSLDSHVKALNRLQASSDIPMLIAMDLEWGLNMRIKDGMKFPYQMTLGAIKDDSLIYKMGLEIANQCRRIGVHINFAPVVDINTNPNNPVISYRSFGENKLRVVSKAKAYMHGLQDGGVIAVAKHFPGHGDTDVDSHLDLPVINHSIKRLEEEELYPFKGLVDDSVEGLMVAHIHIPAYDSVPNMPGTLSKNVVDIARNDLGFKGLIFTDALGMKGVTKHYSSAEIAKMSFKAGNDILVMPENFKEAYNAIKNAVIANELSMKELDDKVRKILMAKKKWVLPYNKMISTSNLWKDVHSKKAIDFNSLLYEKAITVVKNKDRDIPIRSLEFNSFAAIHIQPPSTNSMKKHLDNYASFSHYEISSSNSSPKVYKSIAEKTKDKDWIIVSFYNVHYREGDNNFGLSKSAIDMIKDLRVRSKVVVIVFGMPYSLKSFEDVDYLICGYQNVAHAHKAVAQVLFGAISANGSIPVSASSFLKEGIGEITMNLGRLGFELPIRVGMNEEHLNRIDSLIYWSIDNEVMPGAQVLIARKGKVIYHKNYGYHTYNKVEPVRINDLYDVASITKVASTLASYYVSSRKV